MLRNLLALLVVSAGCASEETAPSGPDYAVTWEAERITYEAGVERAAPLICAPGDYPSLCPVLTSSQRVTIEPIPDGRHAVTWWASSIGDLAVQTLAQSDAKGCPWVDAVSDSTGLRHEFSICADGDGYRGIIEWTVRAHAGHVRFAFVAE